MEVLESPPPPAPRRPSIQRSMPYLAATSSDSAQTNKHVFPVTPIVTPSPAVDTVSVGSSWDSVTPEVLSLRQAMAAMSTQDFPGRSEQQEFPVPGPSVRRRSRRRASLPLLMRPEFLSPIISESDPLESPSLVLPETHSFSSSKNSKARADIALNDTEDIESRSVVETLASLPRSSRSKSRALFHIGGEGSDAENDDSSAPMTRQPSENTLDRSRSRAGSLKGKGKARVDYRKHYALAELLRTELGYLMDIKALLHTYIRLLPNLSVRPALQSILNDDTPNLKRSPTSASFLSTAFHVSSRSTFSHQNDHVEVQTPQIPTSKKEKKNGHRCLLTSLEVTKITRNIADIVVFHEEFVRDLYRATAHLGFADLFTSFRVDSEEHWDPSCVTSTNVDKATRAVSNIFIAQADKFDLYQYFCSGHDEACSLVRKVQKQFPAQWDLFERQSSSMILQMPDTVGSIIGEDIPLRPRGAPNSAVVNMLKSDSFEVKRRRRHSFSSVDFLSTPRLDSTTSDPDEDWKHIDKPKTQSQRSRLVFTDYLIKPVQRVCKYPLLLDQLSTRASKLEPLPSSSEASSSTNLQHDVWWSSSSSPANAVQIMKQVIGAVDEASKRQDILTRSTIIASRIACPTAENLAPYSLTPMFMMSLGSFILAGSMEVVYFDLRKEPKGSMVRSKYLGVFIYPGGYIVMVKLGKSKVYEPRHWFALGGFDIRDVNDEEALLPFSIALSGHGQYFQLTASCEAEKLLWLNALRQSTLEESFWAKAPRPSFHVAADEYHSQASSSTTRAPSIIDTIPEGIAIDAPEILPRCETMPSLSPIPQPETPKKEKGRKSSSSQKISSAVISNELPFSLQQIALRRPSTSVREHVDRGLFDVFSASCHLARANAVKDHVALFPPSKMPRNELPRSSSFAMGTSMGAVGAAAKSKLPKRESMFPSKRKSFITTGEKKEEQVRRPAAKARTVSGKSLNADTKPVLPAIPRVASHDSEFTSSFGELEGLPESPPPLSRSSSTSGPSSIVPPSTYAEQTSPIPIVIPSAPASEGQQTSQLEEIRIPRPKRSRSLVDNVKGFFQQARSLSASRSSSIQPMTPIDAPSSPASSVRRKDNSSPSIRNWWQNSGTFRRRVQSASRVEEGQAPSLVRRTTGRMSGDSYSHDPSFETPSTDDGGQHQYLTVPDTTDNKISYRSQRHVELVRHLQSSKSNPPST